MSDRKCRDFAFDAPVWSGLRVGWGSRKRVVARWAQAVGGQVGSERPIRLRRSREFLPSGFWREVYTNKRYDARLELVEGTYGWQACTNTAESALPLFED